MAVRHTIPPSISIPPMSYSVLPPQSIRPSTISSTTKVRHSHLVLVLCCLDSATSASSSWSPSLSVSTSTGNAPPVIRRRKRYRKKYPGETKGITEEMRFIAMRLRNINGKKYTDNEEDNDDNDNTHNSDSNSTTQGEEDKEGNTKSASDVDEKGDGDDIETRKWQPSMEGFLKYLVDSELVFNTIERIVDDSNDVSYAYFRKTGLERSKGLAKDLEWFRKQGIVIPEPSSPGVSYAKYLEQLGEKSAPLFLCHFYNIYFSHIAGGQVIANQVSEKLLNGRDMESFRWEGDVQESLKGVREKLNMIGEHWSRDIKNKCLSEATKSFRFLGQIVRLIILL